MRQVTARGGAIVAAIALGFSSGCARQLMPGNAPTPVPVVEPAPGAVGLPASGRPAIAPPANGQITEAQVRSFVLSHRLPGSLSATDVRILSISFITSQEVRARLHSARLGVADQEPMCLVIMSGKFVFSGPPGQTPTFPIGVAVFDARTGNLMQSGGLPRLPRGAGS